MPIDFLLAGFGAYFVPFLLVVAYLLLTKPAYKRDPFIGYIVGSVIAIVGMFLFKNIHAHIEGQSLQDIADRTTVFLAAATYLIGVAGGLYASYFIGKHIE